MNNKDTLTPRKNIKLYIILQQTNKDNTGICTIDIDIQSIIKVLGEIIHIELI